MYHGIDIILATKHEKESVINQPFYDALKANIFVPKDYDTDVFGTFSGEIERQGTPEETVIKKAKLAALTYGYNFAVASEGSFGPHPALFFLPADIELMAFIDITNDNIVVETEISTKTNFAHADITIKDDYENFLTKIQFGTHGVIIRSLNDNQIIAKGVTQKKILDDLLCTSFKQHPKIRLETDMRAMMNPTRMQIIRKLANKLANRLLKCCPNCQLPGFGNLSVAGHLPCSACGTETECYKHKVLTCHRCQFSEYLPRDDFRVSAEPTYCPLCNP